MSIKGSVLRESEASYREPPLPFPPSAALLVEPIGKGLHLTSVDKTLQIANPSLITPDDRQPFRYSGIALATVKTLSLSEDATVAFTRVIRIAIVSLIYWAIVAAIMLGQLDCLQGTSEYPCPTVYERNRAWVTTVLWALAIYAAAWRFFRKWHGPDSN